MFHLFFNEHIAG